MDEFYEEPAYSYAPLPGNDFIRILELKPSLNEEAPLQGRLQIARLGHDDYPYDAISYTWGEPVFSQTLYVEATPPNKDLSNGGLYPIGITPNLSKMLQHMRHPLRTRRLWVDALCINQQDDVEKSNQIPLMFQIYQQASRVVIWLGDNIEDQRRMRLLSIFARRRVRHDGPVFTMSHDYLQASREAIYRLTEIPWFSRLWVVQEAVINTDVTMDCGVEKMSLVRLFDIVKDMHSLSESQPARLQSLLVMGNLWNEFARGHASDIPPGRCDGNRPCPTVDIMDRFEHFGCADPRDRVYAISSLQKCMRIAPDYRLSPEQVYLNFTSSMCDHGQLQWVLREVSIRKCEKQTPGLPSWVPDLRMKPIRLPIFTVFSDNPEEYLSGSFDVSAWRQKGGALAFTNYRFIKDSLLSKDREAPIEEHTWDDIRAVESVNRGKHWMPTKLSFDSYSMVATWRGNSFPDQPEPEHAKVWMRTTFEQVWHQFSKRAETASPASSKSLAREACIKTVASVLVADGANIGDLYPRTSKELQALSDSIFNTSDLRTTILDNYLLGGSPLFTECLREIIDDTVNQTPVADKFIQLVMITMQGRCFFTSNIDGDPGNTLGPIVCGIGPSHLQIGDQLLLRYVPFWNQGYLVRARDETEESSISCFELVGDFYLEQPIAVDREGRQHHWPYAYKRPDSTGSPRTIILK